MIRKLISQEQFAFIKGRKLVGGVVALNEVVNMARVSKHDCFIFKVNFEKAYDSLNWSFLDYMLRRLGFDGKWRT